MPFIVDPDPQFQHTVEVRVPTDGGYETQRFKTTFRVMSAEDAAKYDLTDGAASGEFLKKVIIGMADISDEKGNLISYNDALRDRLLSVPYVRRALAETYFYAVSGNA